jgi:hypothetical protein
VAPQAPPLFSVRSFHFEVSQRTRSVHRGCAVRSPLELPLSEDGAEDELPELPEPVDAGDELELSPLDGVGAGVLVSLDRPLT